MSLRDRLNKALGREGEDLAARHLRRLGYRILERNYRRPFGEVDIVAEQGGCLVFAEVKTRRGGRCGSPLEALSAAKKRRLCLAALDYMQRHGLGEREARFDLVAVFAPSGQAPRVEVVVHAFECPEL